MRRAPAGSRATVRAANGPRRGGKCADRLVILLELCATLLCLWAGFYRTPAGALVRMTLARLFGMHSSARPLLAYYSAGVYGGVMPVPTPLRGPVPPGEALGYGAHAVLAQLPPREQAQIAHRAALTTGQLADPAALSLWLATTAKGSSDSAAVLALFCGEEATRFAREASAARAPNLEQLALELPPRYSSEIALASQTMMLGTAFSLGWPVSESAHVTSPFGFREHPILGGKRLHAGVDLGIPVGTPVRAAAAGIVRRASSDSINGKMVIVDHGRGVTTAYLHNDSLLVSVGERVNRGQPLSRSGNSGRSTGPHLHYQLDLAGQPVDPLNYRVSTPAQHLLRAGGSD